MKSFLSKVLVAALAVAALTASTSVEARALRVMDDEASYSGDDYTPEAPETTEYSENDLDSLVDDYTPLDDATGSDAGSLFGSAEGSLAGSSSGSFGDFGLNEEEDPFAGLPDSAVEDGADEAAAEPVYEEEETSAPVVPMATASDVETYDESV